MITIHLDSLRSVSRKTAPGRILSGMCISKWKAYGDGYVPVVLPHVKDLFAVKRGRITPAEYRDRLEALYRWWGWDMDRPQVVSAHDHADIGRVQDGDTIVCACPRPDDPRRRHPFCHLEVVAPFLATPGVRVTLYGQLVGGEE